MLLNHDHFWICQMCLIAIAHVPVLEMISSGRWAAVACLSLKHPWTAYSSSNPMAIVHQYTPRAQTHNRYCVFFSLFKIDLCLCAANTSNIHSAFFMSGRSSLSLVLSMYGTMISLMYRTIISVVDEWFSECQMSQSAWNLNFGWHCPVVPLYSWRIKTK